MSLEINEWFRLETMVTSILSMLIFLGGFYFCVTYRNLSARLLIVAVGFLGLFATAGLNQVSLHMRNNDAWDTVVFMISNVLDLFSFALIVIGLASALAQIRQRIAISLEPTHGRS
jgi:hypothetical protein